MIIKNKKNLFRAVAIFVIWLIAVFYIGNYLNNNIAIQKKENPKIVTTTKNATGEGLSDADKTPEQKANAEKIKNINKKTTTDDLNKIADALKLSNGWDLLNEKTQDGIPILRPYFPKQQNPNGWRESLVFRSFVNVKIKNPLPVVYNIYEEWLKEQLPDMKISHSEEDDGIAFSGYSTSGKIFISGKIFTGSLNETVYIAQYVVKNDGKSDVEQKAKNWSYILSKIK